jgi:hypothetical protein
VLFNKCSFVKTLHSVTAVIELGAGLAFLCLPSTTAKLLVGLPLDTATALTVARICGAGLFSLGVACWLARGDTQSRAAKGLIAALLVYNAAVAVILTFAGLNFGLHGVALWPAVVLHSVMAIWCIVCLRREFGRT